MTAASFFTAFAEAVASQGGLVFLFVVIFITGVRKVWVFGHALTDLRTQLTDERVDHMRELGELHMEVESWRRMTLMLQGQRGPERPPPNPLEGD